ncbi:SGNH/GDSL hydrolase family protein [Streptomyces sp. NPDC057257]|uniref:SGNH/GDSL hydrolase family protein n=1 Tax=Streptomyces sp. NPDC057257 TaxID=3346071 RepID=UPI0036355ED2
MRLKRRLGRAIPAGLRRTAIVALNALGLCCLALAAVWLAVRITPLQSVSAAGQTVRVGAAPVSWSLSGPGRLDLFGQSMPTRPHFDGPIRPRLALSRISDDAEVAQLLRSGDHERLTLDVGHKLVGGWVRYGVWETAVAVGLVLLPLGAWAGLRRMPRRRAVQVLVGGTALVVALNAVGFVLLALDTPRTLHSLKSLGDLVGDSSVTQVPAAEGPALEDVRAVVLGDSTAAGAGNRLVPDAGPLDRACLRSSDSFARVLDRTNEWRVLNLACSGATIHDGLLGVQILGDRVAPPQLAEAKRATKASVVIVSVGANDMRWADLVMLCAAAPTCNDKASTAFFQSRLTRFTLDYRTLLEQVADLPGHPAVIVNEYYDPFGKSVACLRSEGLDRRKVDVLRSRLSAVNAVLRQGAESFGFTAVRPDFEGHGLCSPQPFVQGRTDTAPLHPNAAGSLAIALADQQALPGLVPSGLAAG